MSILPTESGPDEKIPPAPKTMGKYIWKIQFSVLSLRDSFICTVIKTKKSNTYQFILETSTINGEHVTLNRSTGWGLGNTHH